MEAQILHAPMADKKRDQKRSCSSAVEERQTHLQCAVSAMARAWPGIDSGQRERGVDGVSQEALFMI